MRQDQEQYIRDVRGKLAGAIQRAITGLDPFVLAHERQKKWSEVDRFDAVEQVEELQAVVKACHRVLSAMPRQKNMSRVDKERFARALRGLSGADGIAGRITIGKMVSLDKKRSGAGQDYFMALSRELFIVLRHALAAMFYLVNDARIRTIKLNEKTTNEYRYGESGVQAAIEANFEHQARELAHETGSFVEVIAHDGEVLFDASPHASTVRKEMQMVERKSKRAWPYVANPKKKDYDVLLGLYRHKLLK